MDLDKIKKNLVSRSESVYKILREAGNKVSLKDFNDLKKFQEELNVFIAKLEEIIDVKKEKK